MQKRNPKCAPAAAPAAAETVYFAQQSDEALAAKAAHGDADAFAVLLTRYERYIYSTAFGFTARREDADDLTQEILLRIWRSLPQFRCESHFMTWMTRIVHSMCTDWVRRQKKRPPVCTLTPDIDSPDDPPPPEPAADSYDSDPFEVVRREERSRLLREAVASLSEEHRMIVRLRDVENLSYEELAARLGLEVGTVKSRLCRARKQMKCYLDAHHFFDSY